MMRGLPVALPLAVLFAPIPAFAADPAKAPACMEAEEAMLDGAKADAADKFLACALEPGQSAYLIANSRMARLRIFQDFENATKAEAELAALTDPALARTRVFTNTAAGGADAGGEESIGYTQVDLLVMRAEYRLEARDEAGARDLAMRAIALAGYDPEYVFDVAPAFKVLGVLAAIAEQGEKMMHHAVRAYLRGGDDEWIRSVITVQSPQTQAQLLQLREYLHEQVSGYDFAITAKARATRPAAELNRKITEAKVTMTSLKTFEEAQLGPL